MLILAISGSLRARSSNASVLRAAARLAPPGVVVELYDGIATLPHFNPDLDFDAPPAPVVAFRSRVRDAGALLISSPEYAAGVPGAMKNALDWLVGSVDIVDKPVGSINASPRATEAQASLLRTLETISARLVREACVTLPWSGKRLDDEGLLADAEIAPVIRGAVAALARAARA